MRIKTITCHDVYNHGASLQAYALQTYLESLGHSVEIIDYKPFYLSKHYRLWSIDNSFWKQNIFLRLIYLGLKLPRRIISLRRKIAFDKFTKKYLILTSKKYRSNDELKLDCPVADLFIAGSDQIWSCLSFNGKDPAFYLDFVPKNVAKASYAASFASETLEDEFREKVRKRLKYLDNISVRESSGLAILKSLGINNGVQVLDPVFLLNKDHWDTMSINSYQEDYLFVYDFDDSEQVKDISLKIARDKNLKIYSVNCNKSYIDKKFIYSGPETFVSLIKHSKYVVSNSFHGTAFALLFEKDFVVVERLEGINARMVDLLKSLQIPERLLFNYSKLSAVNYVEVNQQLVKLIEQSKLYLNRVLICLIIIYVI